MPPEPAPLPPAERVVVSWPMTILRIGLRLAVVAAVVLAVHLAGQWLEQRSHVIDEGRGIGTLVLIGMLVAYAAMIAMPFVPGIEIGVALMMLRGGEVAPFVYLATIAGLFLAYLLGLRMPYAVLHRFFADLRMRPACRLLERIAPLSPDERLAALQARLPRWIAPYATRHRHVLLGIAINVPGNGVVGGGGGLCLLAGLSRLYRPAATALTLAIAVAPVPLLVWLLDRPVVPLVY